MIARRAILWIAAIAPPLCLDGAPPWATLVTACLGALLALSALSEVDAMPWRRPPALVMITGAALVWTAAGLLPLPAWLLRALTQGSSPPIALEHAEITASLLERPPPALLGLTTSPADTRHAVVIGAAVLAYVLAGSIYVARGRRRHVLEAIAASSIAMSAVVLGHLLVGTSRVYGVITPAGTMTLPSPLVNENHLSGFLAVGAAVCVGLALSSSARGPMLAWLGAAVLDAVLCLGCVSRGGALGLVVSLVSIALLSWVRRPDGAGSRSPRRLAAGAGILVFALGLAVYGWYDALARDVRGTTLYKVRMAIRGLDLVARSPWVGVGRGGYSAAFVGLAGTDTRFEYPESFPVQWAAEWGAPFALGLFVLLALMTLRAIRATRNPERAGALAALLGLAVHELVDFATEMPGVLVVAALVVTAALDGRAHGDDARGASRGPWLVVPVLTLLVVAWPGVTTLGTSITDRTDAVRAAIEHGGAEAADALLATALDERPGEPNFVLLGAYARARRDDPTTPRWLNAAMRIAPGWSSPHLVAATWLARRGARRQAWLELREVERVDRGRSTSVACTFLVSEADGEEVVRVMRDEPGGQDFLEGLVVWCHEADPAATGRIDAALLELHTPTARRRAAQRALTSGDPIGALSLIDGMTDDDDPWTSLVRADALVAANRPSDAVAVLRRVHPRGVPRGEVLRRLARAEAADGDEAGMRETIGQLQGEAEGRAADMADALMFLGELEADLGHRDRAYEAFERADDVDPTRGALRREEAVAGRLGDAYRANLLHARVCQQEPGSPGCTAGR